MSVYDEKPWLSLYDQGQPAEIALEFTDALSMFRASVSRNPDGDIIAGPAANEETVLYADIDMSYLRGSKLWFDAAGHYCRPDVFQLTVNREARSMMQTTDGATTPIEPQVIAKSRPRKAG